MPAKKLCQKFKLIDALDYYPPIKADTLLVEMMSIWCIDEPQISIINHALVHILKKDGQFVPRKIINLVELGYYDFNILSVACKVSIPLFTGIPSPRIMTVSKVFNAFNLLENNAEVVENNIQIKTLLNGKVNCARLTSLVQLSENITFYTSDSLMPQTLVPLNEISVKAGDQLCFSAAFKLRSNLDENTFKLSAWKW